MSKIIIGIHGLGNKPCRKLLKRWWWSAIKEGLARIGKYSYFTRFELVYWADVLNDRPLDHRVKDEEDPLYLGERYCTAPVPTQAKPHRLRKKILSFLEKQLDKLFLNEDGTINFTAITDYIIHKMFRDLEVYFTIDCESESEEICRARQSIRKKVAGMLEKYDADQILLVTHSMGTIITYDVLTLLLPELKIDTWITMGSPLGLTVIQNKIARERGLLLKPGEKLRTPENIQRYWYNFSDLEDKVAFNYNLADDYGANTIGVKPIDFVVSNDYENRGKINPHKSYGYLRTAEVTGVIDAFLERDRLPPARLLMKYSNEIMPHMIKLWRWFETKYTRFSGRDDEPEGYDKEDKGT